MQPHTFNPKTTGEIGRNPNLLAKSSNPFRHQVAASPSGPCRICCRCFPERQMVCQVDGLDLFETLEHMRKIPAGKPRPPNPQEKPLVSSGSLVTRLVASLGDDWFSLFFLHVLHLYAFGIIWCIYSICPKAPENNWSENRAPFGLAIPQSFFKVPSVWQPKPSGCCSRFQPNTAEVATTREIMRHLLEPPQHDSGVVEWMTF